MVFLGVFLSIGSDPHGEEGCIGNAVLTHNHQTSKEFFSGGMEKCLDEFNICRVCLSTSLTN